MASFSGLLILDNSRRELADKVRRAVKLYERKHGISPGVCYVHPSELEEPVRVDSVAVEPRRGVLKHHYWVGMEVL